MKNFITSLEICMLLTTLSFTSLAAFKLYIETDIWIDNFEEVLRYGLIYGGVMLGLSFMHFIISKKIIKLEDGKKK